MDGPLTSVGLSRALRGLAVLVFFISLTVHGPAGLVSTWVAGASRGAFLLTADSGHWYAGEGWLQAAGAQAPRAVSWRLGWRGFGPELTLTGAVSGTLACDLRQGCGGNALSGRLPAAWAHPFLPVARLSGLAGELEWRVARVQWDWSGRGSLELSWLSGPLRAEALDLPLGAFSGSLAGGWNGALSLVRLPFSLASSRLPGAVPPLAVDARGELGPGGVSLAGTVSALPGGDGRYGRLLQMAGLPPAGGRFSYQGAAASAGGSP